MKEVNLYVETPTGRAFVATVNVPEMKPMPEIVVWGARYFVRQKDEAYTEGIVWVVQGNTISNVTN